MFKNLYSQCVIAKPTISNQQLQNLNHPRLYVHSVAPPARRARPSQPRSIFQNQGKSSVLPVLPHMAPLYRTKYTNVESKTDQRRIFHTSGFLASIEDISVSWSISVQENHRRKWYHSASINEVMEVYNGCVHLVSNNFTPNIR